MHQMRNIFRRGCSPLIFRHLKRVGAMGARSKPNTFRLRDRVRCGERRAQCDRAGTARNGARHTGRHEAQTWLRYIEKRFNQFGKPKDSEYNRSHCKLSREKINLFVEFKLVYLCLLLLTLATVFVCSCAHTRNHAFGHCSFGEKSIRY